MENFQQKPKLIYTPLSHIPIGEPMKADNGTWAIKFKKPGRQETEVVSIDTLISMVFRATDKCN